jgi:dihydrofolate synthase/folylpolyglutamate synthase
MSMAQDALTYQEALDYLYSFIDYSQERSGRYSADAFELDRVRRLLAELGDPHQHYPSLHIAGTKGKGSVAALMESALRAHGYRTGLYTSPHLVDFRERIQIAGEPVAQAAVISGVERLRQPAAHQPGITTYELITALAFLLFAEQEIEVGVFEVGLGGRLDATNVIDPLVSVITSISFDHTHLLGSTLPEIAGEKGGIIKSETPVVLAPMVPQAADVLRTMAEARRAPVHEVEQMFRVKVVTADLGGQRLQVLARDATDQDPVELYIPLLGEHQAENAATAYLALVTAGLQGLDISLEAIQRGFRNVSWPGRFQVLRQQPVVVLDAAHNRDSAARLRQTVEQMFPGRPVHLIFGASEDKDIEGMLHELASITDKLTLTQAIHPRAAEPVELKALAADSFGTIEIVVPPRQAVARALAEATADDVILISGSLFVVGEVLAAWPVEPAAQRQPLRQGDDA